MSLNRILILYGSESGTAQDFAERIWRESRLVGLKGPVLAMDDYDITNLIYEDVVVFVCSTTGQGDVPTNMRRFWKFLLRKNLPANSLQNVKFGVLGLGDSSYSKFNHTGKKLYRRLLALGGRQLLDIGLADDQHDLGPDAVVDPWIANLWATLLNSYSNLKLPSKSNRPLNKWHVECVSQNPDNFVWPLNNKSSRFKVASNIRTTPEQHFQEVRLIRFESVEDRLSYQSGDVAIVRPQNRKESVDEFFTVLTQFSPDAVLSVTTLDPDMPVPPHLRKPVSLKTLVTSYWDLNMSPRRYVFELLSHFTPSDLEKEKLIELSSAEGQEEMFSYCSRPRRTIMEVLADFPQASANLPLDYLFDVFLPIRPRHFSIASPPQESYAEILVAVVKYKTKLFIPRFGLCSTWLANLSPDTCLDVAIIPGSMRFMNERHLLMVGPGTGIAPFRSYICSLSQKENRREIIERREELAPPGEPMVQEAADRRGMTLVFGCRNSQSDFHFKQDLIGASDLKLFTAFSRDQPHKIYVQHVIIENGAYFSDLLSNGNCCVMVAGNAKDMPDAVRDAFVTALTTRQGLKKEEAEKLIEQMEAQGYYQTETWS